MADKQVQRRHGTTLQHAGFTGADRELTVDITKNTVVVHDGVTPGGHPLMKEDARGVADGVASLDGTGKVPSAQLPSVAPTSAYAFRNVLLNPNFAINQDAKSGSVVLAAGAYGHDGWKAGAGGCTYTFAKSLNITTVTISAGTLLQIIEGANLQSGTYYLSWTGTAQGRVDAGAYGATGITGTAVGGTNQTVEFNAGTLAKVQYELDGVTPFEFRPIQLDLAMALRYYETSYPVGVVPGSVITIAQQVVLANLPASITSTYDWGSQVFKAAKRAAPTVIVYSRLGASNTANNDGGANYLANGATPGNITEQGFKLNNAGGSTMNTSFGTAYLNWVANARL